MATALSVHYKCISEASVFTICSDVIFQDTEQLYLATPNFPSNNLKEQKNCSCTVTGENINGTVLQHTRAPDSSVIMILSTNRGTHHINGRNILNNLIFSNLTKINLFLENELDQQVYKLWLGFTGKGMSLKCQYEQPQPVTSPAGVSVNPTSSLVSPQLVTNPAGLSVNPTSSLVTGTSSWVTDKTEEAILLSTQQSKLDQTVLFPQNISITPTEMYSSKSNIIIKCSETQNDENIKCESSTALFGISSSLSETPESSAWIRKQDSLVSTSGDLISSEIKSTMQDNTRGTKESKTESLSLARTRTETILIHSSSSTDGQSFTSNTVGASTTNNSGILLEASPGATNPGTAETDTMVTSARTKHILGTNSVSSVMASSVIPNTTQSTPGFQQKTSDQDIVLLVIVGCLALVLLAAMVIFTVIMWRRANTNEHTQEETHIYDAYHHDNGSLGPDHLGDGHSFYTDLANESIMI